MTSQKLSKNQKEALASMKEYGPIWVSRRNTPQIMKTFQSLVTRGLAVINVSKNNPLMLCFEIKQDSQNVNHTT